MIDFNTCLTAVVAFCLLITNWCDPVVAQTAQATSKESKTVSAALDADASLQSMILGAQPAMAKIFGAAAGKVDGVATGFAVSQDGLVLTSQGVFLDGKRVRVVLADGSSHNATVLKRDRQRQLALLKIETKLPHWFELSKEPIVQQGDWVVAICNAFKVADKTEPISATLGIVSLQSEMEAKLTRRDYAFRGELFLIDAITSNPGAAGGAVLTLDGRLAGLVGKIINSSETNTRLNYAVPNNTLHDFVYGNESLAANSSKTNDGKTPATAKEIGELGIQVFLLGGTDGPAYVDRVKRGSPAAKAGLKADDVIISINGEKIGSVKDFQDTIKTLAVGEEVLLIYKRADDLVREKMVPMAKRKRKRK